MLVPVVAALMLLPLDAADQGRPATRTPPPVVLATQASQVGPSLAGFGVFVWAPFTPSDEAHPQSVWQTPVPKRRTMPPFWVPGPLAPDDGTTVALPPPSAPVKRKVVCGTTVIIVDSQIDPKFVIAPKPGAGEPTIRRVPKPMCGSERK